MPVFPLFHGERLLFAYEIFALVSSDKIFPLLELAIFVFVSSV